MADRCAGCTNKFKFREKPAVCAKCGRNFCTLCIPKSKHRKSAPAVRETCIYCTRRVQEAMRQQEAGVMENFPDRFYHSPHVQAPVVTKLRLNEEKLHSTGGLGGGSRGGPVLTEEDRKLEERLRRLKESHRPTKTGDSETVLQERLAKLRDEEESQGPPSSTSNQSSGQPTETEQADNLVDQMSDRVKLDGKTDPKSQPLEDSISTLLSGMDIQIGDEDPNKLFEDFRAFQSRQEQSAAAEATSKEVQGIVVKAKDLQRQEQEEIGETTAASGTFITPYPQLPPEITVESHGEQKEREISETEISQVLAAAQREIEQEERRQREMDRFVSAASKQLAELRGTDSSKKMEGDSEVRSKLEPRQGGESHLDFSWSHFGSGGGHLEVSPEGGVGGETAARQLGITLSSEVIQDGATDSGDEVSGLLKQTLAEAALDRRLEEKGLDRYLKPSGAESKSSTGGGGGATARGSGDGACAATPLDSEWKLDPDDLPWCCICNADAHIRCYDCDNDLYCTPCFSEGHEQFGLFDHKYAPFEPLTSRAV